MPINVGIDLVDVGEVAQSLGEHGHRYLERVYTHAELRECHSDPHELAERFAAKEATMKVLSRREEPIPWRSIEIRVRHPQGPSVELRGAAAQLARRQGVATLSVSLARWGDTAAAVVTADYLSPHE